MNKLYAVILLFLLLSTIVVAEIGIIDDVIIPVVVTDSFFDIIIDLMDKVEETEDVCALECANVDCDLTYKENARLCFEERKNACSGLRGKERWKCMRPATQKMKECIAAAKDVQTQCTANAEGQVALCNYECKLNVCEIITVDVDIDGIPDAVDNCELYNPDQGDVDGDGIGDTCDEFTCCVGGPLGECFPSSIGDCEANDGAVMECLPPEPIAVDTVPGKKANHSPVTYNASDSALKNLSDAVKGTNISELNYSAAHDCDDFADELERNLTALGYNATFTVYWCYGGAGNPPASAHAVSDVHLADGRTVFIEPQTGQIIDIDFDKDGTVEVLDGNYVPGANKGQTDDNCKIAVFGSKAEAVAAGISMD